VTDFIVRIDFQTGTKEVLTEKRTSTPAKITLRARIPEEVVLRAWV
jgi:hypothetical protein